VIEQPLLFIDGATEGTTQWRAATLQMVNWGGFHGYHQAAFSPTATLISGASGTGKSTMLDAYLALMMPSDTPFNGASNDATTGRARSADQRNLVTYLRGKTDANRERGTDEMRDQVLRGAEGSTWGAVAMTFMDDNKRQFTVLRAYYVPRGATKFADITMKMATKDGPFDLRELADAVETKFDKRAMKNRFPGLEVFDTYAGFAQALYTRLGIGANGDGGNALRLLARMQTGQQVKTVDGLYKSMVLDEPATYAAADRAIGHFVDLERSYEAMLTEGEKAKVLERLPDLHRDYQSATASADLIDIFGVHRDGDTPFALWCLRTERALLDQAVRDNRQRRSVLYTTFTTARDNDVKLRLRIAELQRQQRENGGDVLDRLKTELADLDDRREEVFREQVKFEQRTQPLSVVIRSADEFSELRTTAEHFIESFPDKERELEDVRTELGRQQYPLEKQIRDLKDEHESLSGREGLVPPPLHRARVTIAEQMDCLPEDLPFVAELIDIAAGEERWRKAAEVTLSATARIMLIDEDLLDQLSRTIDSVHIPVRINFEGVPLHDYEEFRGDPRRISGKLVFKDSLFRWWVQNRVQVRSTDALCVQGPEELGGDDLRVTPNGQTRYGKRGAHGELRDRNIIGFSNKARLAEITEEISGLEASLGVLSRQAGAVGADLAKLRGRRDAYQFVLDIVWSAIDLDGVDAEIEAKKTEQQRILASSDILRHLKEDEERLSTEHTEVVRTKNLAEKDIGDLDAKHGGFANRQDVVSNEAKRIERGQSVSLHDGHSAHLDNEFAAVSRQGDLSGFEDGIVRLRKRLIDQGRQARESAQRASESLTRVFQAFQGRWPDPNLGVAITSYGGYRDLLDEILTTGLHERRQEWTRRLSMWSGQDLVPLNGAFETSIEDVEERLLPINDILATLPFGTGRDRLRISLRRLQREDIKRFRKDLKSLSSGTTEDPTDEQIETRFKRLRTFMNQIRKPEAGAGAKNATQRDYLLDVRKHVEITAVRLTTDGVEVSTYSALGGKSGGETQELVAFIVGAALRFQLGDESRTRPRFAPVILDEGFVKADSKFAGRAVAAWKGLGFQLIIGAPWDKVTALEPHMDVVLSITKNDSSGYSYVRPLSSRTGAVK
jgi:uncharacterized protein YPO0396